MKYFLLPKKDSLLRKSENCWSSSFQMLFLPILPLTICPSIVCICLLFSVGFRWRAYVLWIMLTNRSALYVGQWKGVLPHLGDSAYMCSDFKSVSPPLCFSCCFYTPLAGCCHPPSGTGSLPSMRLTTGFCCRNPSPLETPQWIVLPSSMSQIFFLGCSVKLIGSVVKVNYQKGTPSHNTE